MHSKHRCVPLTDSELVKTTCTHCAYTLHGSTPLPTFMSYWANHKPEIIIWALVGLILLLLLVWCFHKPTPVCAQPAAPALYPRLHHAIADIELAPLPRVFVPAPLYEYHERGLWLPSDTELEKRVDGYLYPKHLGEARHEASDGS